MKIGIDLGGTNIAAGLVDNQGELIKVLSEATPKTQSAIIEVMVRLAKKLTAGTRVQMIGIGVPGVLSADGKRVVSCPNADMTDTPLVQIMETFMEPPVYLVNDANAAGLAESYYGALKGEENAAMLTLGTGIGGYLMVAGKMVTGAHGCATELGHTYVGPRHYNCGCGLNGCLETFSSIRGLKASVVKVLEEGVVSEVLAKSAKENKLNGKLILDRAKTGDPVALIAFDTMVYGLSVAIRNLILFTDPAVIAFGGGLAGAGDFLFNALKDALIPGQLAFPNIAVPKLVSAELGNDAGIIGATLLDRLN